MSFSNAGTHDTGDTGSWYKPDQYNYKYNGYSGHNDNNNYSDKPHKKWHYHGGKSGDLVVNNQNADCSSTSNANGGAGNGGNDGGGGTSNGGGGGSSLGAPGVGGSSVAGSSTSCSNTSTFNISK
jgi:hypothetical protein